MTIEAGVNVTFVALRAIDIAREHEHETATLEHLLAAILEQSDVQACFKTLKLDHDALVEMVDSYLSSEHLAHHGGVPMKTNDFDALCMRTVGSALFSHRRTPTGLDMLLHMTQFPADDSHAVSALMHTGVTTHLLKRYFSHGPSSIPDGSAAMARTHDGGEPVSDAEPQTREDAVEYLKKYCLDLNAEARNNRIDPMIGRADEVEQITQIIARRTKNNVVLVGDAGVGKTSIAEGIAHMIVSGNVPEVIAKCTVWSLDIGSLVAGTRFRGDFEERMKLVVKSLIMSENAILFIDEIHTIMDAGSGNKGSLDVANLLKPALAKGTLRCIGSTTAEEYRKHFEKDRALVRRFKKVIIEEPSPETTKLILRGLRSVYEGFHGVTYTDCALDAAVDLTHKYVTNALLPDKAIDIIDNAGARQRINSVESRLKVIDLPQIEAEVIRVAHIPAQEIQEAEEHKLLRLEEDLRANVFGQDRALSELTDAVFVSRAGLRDTNKPAISFLFTGSTGTGKTAAAIVLAETMGLTLHKFDMSEYMEKHSVSKLIGSPPGYVGYGDGGAGDGLMINALDNNPSCVLLLDEIEKAHPDVFNILLQVMDDGKLTNSAGKTVSFRNAVLIMTSNAGVAESERPVFGFGNRPEDTDIDNKAIKRVFTPEFRNRLDAIIAFDRLKPAAMTLIVDKFVAALREMTIARGVELEVDSGARLWLADRGYDPVMGARPLNRVIHDFVKKPLSKMMLIGSLKSGGIARVSVKNKMLDVEGVPDALKEPLSE